MSLSISGKTAIVTGAAHGIGACIARHFVDRGANVMFADIDDAKLCADVGEDAANEGPVRYFAGDLCQKLTINNLISATIDAFDRIDILVNASRCFAVSDPLSVEVDLLDKMLRQNLTSGLRLSQMVAKRMISQAEKEGREEGEAIGSIINLSSIAAQRSQPELLAYSIACAAQDHLPHMRDIEQPRLRAAMQMLFEHAHRILHGHLVARKRHHLRAKRHMQIKQTRPLKVGHAAPLILAGSPAPKPWADTPESLSSRSMPPLSLPRWGA